MAKVITGLVDFAIGNPDGSDVNVRNSSFKCVQNETIQCSNDNCCNSQLVQYSFSEMIFSKLAVDSVTFAIFEIRFILLFTITQSLREIQIENGRGSE